MAAAAHVDSKRLYSWWWDSHISPKNSKWLQENLTDMDTKVKQMIKLIEEDADSFARRAEMYYKKRPELMKLVEEFYRAYRSLAERYDNATGVLRQAHRTMAEAFPNQVSLVLADDSPAGSANEADPHTPEIPSRALLYPDELQKDALGLSPSHFPAVKRNGAFTDEPDSVSGRKGLKQLNDLFGSAEAVNHAKFAEGRVRKGLSFHDVEEKKESEQSKDSHDLKARILSESKRVSKTELEILSLKKSLAKLESEKEAGLLQYQQSLERLSNLESQVSHAQDDSRVLNERASKAEAEVLILKEALSKLEVEKEASLLQYQHCLDKISDLENISNSREAAGELDKQACKAEIEAEAIKKDLDRVEAEKEAALAQYKQCFDMVLNLKEKLQHGEEVARKISERADKAESKVETLKQALARVTEEKEAAAVQYQECLEKISSLEHKLSCAEEEAQRLNSEIDNGVAKLKGVEERCLLLEKSNQTLQSDVESLLQKMGTQSEELTEKQKELGRLWTCVQEERLRFIEAETAFQTLQHLHSQSQEELRSLATELQNRAQILKDMETHNQGLQDEVQKVKEDNKGLNELNLSSAVSMKNLKDEILNLRETIRKLEHEVELRMDQRNALQQEIYCLKQELNNQRKKYEVMQEEVDSVGLDPECFGSTVKELQDENTKMKEICERERSEKVSLLEKLVIMEELIEKNALLENSLSDLNVELEGVRGKVKALEESCQSLLGDKSALDAEKATLISKLQLTTENLEKLSANNNFLENSLADANAELEGLRGKSKSLEDSFRFLDKEKSGLISERESLVSRLDITRQSLEDLEKRYTESEEELSGLEKERECRLREVEELWFSLDAEKQEHVSFVQLSEARLAGLELQIRQLQEECQCLKKDYEEELDKAINSQIENFILQKFAQDLEENFFSLLIEYQKVLEASNSSEKLISELELESLEQQMEVKSLSDQIIILRMGLNQVLKSLDNDADHGFECKDKTKQDQTVLNHIRGKIQDTQNSLFETGDENQQLVIEKSVLLTILGQLKLEATNLATEKNTLDQEFRIQSEQFSLLQIETQKLIEMNEELRSKAVEGSHKEEVLTTEIGNLHGQLLDLQGAYQTLLEENCKVLEEKRSLMKEVLDLGEAKRNLEDENCITFSEAICQSNLSLIFRDTIAEKSVELKELSEIFNKLQFVNNDLVEKVKIIEGKLEYEIANGRDQLCQKENELLEAEQMLSTVQNEKTDLHKVVEDMKCKYDEINLVQEDQGKKIMKLSGDYDNQSKEFECLRETNLKMDDELGKLCEQLEETKRREESLSYELQKERNEVGLWEAQASAFFGELQISTVCESLFEEKMHELAEACKSFEDRSNSKDMEIGLLKERVSTLEGENGQLKSQMAAYFPAVISLRDCIASLENHTLLHTKPHKASDEVKDVVISQSDLHAVSCQQTSEDQIARVPDGFSDLQDLEMRIKAMEKAVMETERLAMLENLNANARLEAAMRQLKESASSVHQENVQTRKHLTLKQVDGEIGDGLSNDLKHRKQRSEIFEDGHEVLPKDIMLDHISECSSYGLSRRENAEANAQMLELWETTDRDGSIDLTVGKGQKVAITPYQQTKAVRQRRSANPSIESLIVKELGVDKLDISNRFTEPREGGNKRKILERLDSDVQKLTNLQITVQDLKRKVAITEKSKKGKGIEYDTVKEQLEEAEEAIIKLFDGNRKLMKNIEDGSLSSDGKSGTESEESRSARRRRASEQARRGSEKIGRLQLEVQKLQFLLLKLDDEKESRGRTKITARKTRVLLRDYLYGGTRTSQKKKKASFCACVQPPTKGDHHSVEL